MWVRDMDVRHGKWMCDVDEESGCGRWIWEENVRYGCVAWM